MSAPTIKDQINTPNAVIEGGFDIKRAEDLALVLRSGSLPASIQYLEERTVGPSWGAIPSGRASARAFSASCSSPFHADLLPPLGVNAVAALALNVVILLGVMAYFKATLTLPGIAGVILTVGMAVDYNVLVFERIREELLSGKSVKASIALGFPGPWPPSWTATSRPSSPACFSSNSHRPIKGLR